VRTALAVLATLIVGAGLGVGGLHVAHKLNIFTNVTTSTVAQASAGYGLNTPTAAVLMGSRIYIANEGGNSVTVVDASTGSHVTTLQGQAFGFDRPTAVAALGQDLFVANGAGNSVTEVDTSSRAPVRTIAGPQFRLKDPIALAAAAGTVYVLSARGPVTAIAAASGGLTAVASGPQYGFAAPRGLAVTGSQLYITDSSANAVTEVNARTMAFVRMLTGPGYKFQSPIGAAVEGKNLWVTNRSGDSVTEIATSSDRPVRVVVDHANLPTPGPVTVGDGYVFALSPPGDSPMVTQVTPDNGAVPWMMCNTNGPYLFSDPQAAVVSGNNLWVVNKGSSSLTEMNTDSGALIRTIS
jgi:YVTN family beta-propeller protein